MKLAIGCLLVSLVYASHYEKPPCQSDEMAASIQGGSVTGEACFPKCDSTGSCPTDVVSGVTAKPQCAIKDQSGNKYCGLICSSDSECDSAGGAKCSLVQGAIGICEYPTSSKDESLVTVSVVPSAVVAPATPHYEKPPCQSDEMAASIQGGSVTGEACFPKCDSTGSCPTDVVSGVTAKPQCAIKDQSGNKYCGLICSSDSECDSAGGAKCSLVQGAIGICEYPTSSKKESLVIVSVVPSAVVASATPHYEKPPCQSDEMAASIQGGSVTGEACFPKCDSTGSCPTDVVSGVTAKPQCAIKDQSGNKYCGLICSSDSECDSAGGAKCSLVQGAIGICEYPTSSKDENLVIVSVVPSAVVAPATPHYEKPPCQSDEMAASIQGGSVTGEACFPKCDSTGSCPTDVVSGVTAKPQCAIKDQSGNKYCGLICSSDSECDSAGGAKCSLVQGAIGICEYPTSSKNESLVTVSVVPSAVVAPATPHYEKPPCQSDEMAASIQGGSVTGEACFPKCDSTGSCPTDVVSGVTAKPQCAIKDQSGNKYCGLICSSDSECDSAGGAKCSLVQGAIGICEYPTSSKNESLVIVSVVPSAVVAPATPHYEKPPCQSDEMAASIQGGSVTGEACFPKCDSTGSCPTDVVSGVTAKPQCAIKDQSGHKYCGLICSSDSECDSAGGAKCSLVQGAIGICEYPTSSKKESLVTVSVVPSAVVASATPHYEKPPCQSDEMAASIQGGSVTGEACFPKCDSTGSCPTDVVSGVTAKPQCAIKDQSGNKYCGLICSSDSECDSAGGAKCSLVQGAIGICEYPTSSKDESLVTVSVVPSAVAADASALSAKAFYV